MTKWHRWSEGELTNLPWSSALESYTFRPDPTLFKVQKLTETLKTCWGQGPKLAEVLHTLFDQNKKSQSFSLWITETRDKEGVKRYKFQPEYVDHLMLAMQLVTSILNDYLQAAGNTRAFLFGKSSHYEIEFSDLVYQQWATCLILESFEHRLLGPIQLAKEAIESFINESEFKPGEGPPCIASPVFSTSTTFADDICWMIAMDQGSTLRNSPQAEDQCCMQQLQQNMDVAFSSMLLLQLKV